jgi:hypothetical protein
MALVKAAIEEPGHVITALEWSQCSLLMMNLIHVFQPHFNIEALFGGLGTWDDVAQSSVLNDRVIAGGAVPRPFKIDETPRNQQPLPP